MSIYDFVFETPTGEKVSLSEYEGKTLLIVNTASKCNFTPQFDGLQKLQEQFDESKFQILGFPCNQFDEQEPGSNEEALAFCQMNYGVQFPVFSKINVNGENAHPLFTYLSKQAPFKGFDESNFNAKLLKAVIDDKIPEWSIGDYIKWNFTKFLVNNKGEVIRRYEPYVEPVDMEKDVQMITKFS
ncbi:glutathione peroxidase [Texcoconibacillus texcoconensis]|uniref:Glutathione peroxidase n=1 Tax=Texcoconibacillus texcoconensis TaxID=1095777 RepID=A0A840QLQ3_9BACI|nr:glutathione peroxidase [Texcoconibacillus texcoconensis]MBB5172302.1 glutathione peroxidase [Texcoconibacillus texcoconensis]